MIRNSDEMPSTVATVVSTTSRGQALLGSNSDRLSTSSIACRIPRVSPAAAATRPLATPR